MVFSRVWIAKLGGELGSCAGWQTCFGGYAGGIRRSTQTEPEIVMLENFFDELRRRVPLSK